MRRIASLVAFSLLLSFAVACESATTSPQAQTIESATFNADLGVNLAASTKLSNGVYIRDLLVGTGDAVASNDSVYVRYSGYLTNGTRFDTNEPNGAYLEFRVGKGGVIPGFETGVIGMKVGGRRQIIIPPSQGYGDRAQGPIPGGSILVFNVTVAGKR